MLLNKSLDRILTLVSVVAVNLFGALPSQATAKLEVADNKEGQRPRILWSIKFDGNVQVPALIDQKRMVVNSLRGGPAPWSDGRMWEVHLTGETQELTTLGEDIHRFRKVG